MKISNMRYLFILSISLILFATSCRPKEDSNSIDSLKKNLSEKKKEMSNLQKEIDEIESKIIAINPPKKKYKPVMIDTIKKSNFKRFVEVQSSVQSSDLVNVSSSTGGRILSVNAKEGQSVRKGQLIATLDLESVEKQIQELTISKDLANTVFERQKRLWDQNIGSEIQYLEAKNNKERLEKSIESLNLQLSKKNVYAPISGVVDMEFLKQGEMASPGMPIIQILNTRQVKIVADVPEKYLPNIKRGDNVDIHIPALGLDMSKRISLIGRSIDPSNRTFKLEIETGNEKNVLKPNLLALLKFVDLEVEDAIVVPLNIVQEEVNGQQFVYVAIKKDGDLVAQKNYISIGESYEGNVIVNEGVQSNELIVTEGSRSINAGDLLNIQ